MIALPNKKAEMYIYQNKIQDVNSCTIGAFSSHIAAFTAFMKLQNSNWKPLDKNVWKPEDEHEFKRLSNSLKRN